MLWRSCPTACGARRDSTRVNLCSLDHLVKGIDDERALVVAVGERCIYGLVEIVAQVIVRALFNICIHAKARFVGGVEREQGVGGGVRECLSSSAQSPHPPSPCCS